MRIGCPGSSYRPVSIGCNGRFSLGKKPYGDVKCEEMDAREHWVESRGDAVVYPLEGCKENVYVIHRLWPNGR